MTGTDLRYALNGYQYRTYLDVEEDNMKIFHYCYKDGKPVQMPREFYNQSPYEYITPDEFRSYIQTLEVFIQG